MFCVYTEAMAQDDTVTVNKTTPFFLAFFLCLRLISVDYAALTVTKGL